MTQATLYQTLLIIFSVAGSFTLSTWMIKRWIAKVDVKIDSVVVAYHACREDLPKSYAPKEDTEKKLAGVFSRLEEHTGQISFIKGKANHTGCLSKIQ